MNYRTLLLDSDTMVLANPYPLLRQLRRTVGTGVAIGLEDASAWPVNMVNGGTWYLSASPRGSVENIFAGVMRRARAVLDEYPLVKRFDLANSARSADFLIFDQILINLEIISWQFDANVELRSSRQMMLSALLQGQSKAVAAAAAKHKDDLTWRSRCCMSTPAQIGSPPWHYNASGLNPMQKEVLEVRDLSRKYGTGHGGSTHRYGGLHKDSGKWSLAQQFHSSESGQCRPPEGPWATAWLQNVERQSKEACSCRHRDALREECKQRLVPQGTAQEFRYLVLRNPSQRMQRPEILLKAPQWLFASESDMRGPSGRTVASFWGAQPPPAALVHFVCSSWPGSDGRRSAMRLWGRWHSAEIYAEAPPEYRQIVDHRLRGFLTFAGTVDAPTPTTLMPYLRLLTLAAHITGRTPVLPMMRCNASGTTWIDKRVDVRTGHVIEGTRVSGRACGWVVHKLGGEELSEPLCVQRPLTGCFHAFATPDEIAAFSPPGLWAHSSNHTGLSQDKLRSLPLIELLRRSDTANVTIKNLRDRLRKHILPTGSTSGFRAKRSGADAVEAADTPSEDSAQRRVVFLKPPTAEVLADHSIFSKLAAFDRALQHVNRGRTVPVDGPSGWRSAWFNCLKMVRMNRCTAVC